MDLFLCVLIASQVTVTTTTPPVTYVLQSIVHHYDGYAESHLCGPDDVRSAWYGSTAIVDSEGHIKGFCQPHHNAAATTTSVLDIFSGICHLCHRSSAGKFLFQSWASQWFLHHVLVSYGVFFCFQVPMWLPCSPMGVQLLGFATPQPFIFYPWQAFLPSDDGLQPTLWVHQVYPPTALSQGSLPLLIQLSPSHSIPMGLNRKSADPSAFSTWCRGVFFFR